MTQNQEKKVASRSRSIDDLLIGIRRKELLKSVINILKNIQDKMGITGEEMEDQKRNSNSKIN